MPPRQMGILSHMAQLWLRLARAAALSLAVQWWCTTRLEMANALLVVSSRRVRPQLPQLPSFLVPGSGANVAAVAGQDLLAALVALLAHTIASTIRSAFQMSRTIVWHTTAGVVDPTMLAQRHAALLLSSASTSTPTTQDVVTFPPDVWPPKVWPPKVPFTSEALPGKLRVRGKLSLTLVCLRLDRPMFSFVVCDSSGAYPDSSL